MSKRIPVAGALFIAVVSSVREEMVPASQRTCLPEGRDRYRIALSQRVDKGYNFEKQHYGPLGAWGGQWITSIATSGTKSMQLAAKDSHLCKEGVTLSLG